MDIILTLTLYSVRDVKNGFAERFKRLRLSKGLTQFGLAKRSGVSLGSLKRFERSGEVSLGTLLHMANSLEFLDDFYDFIGRLSVQEPTSLKALINPPKHKSQT